MRTKILITGATGFVGRALIERYRKNQEIQAIGVCRSMPSDGRAESLRALGDLETADFAEILQGVDVVIHAAARAHIMRNKAAESLSEYRRVNVQGTLHLASQAAVAGVRRFIFISSIKVNGESTELGQPFTADEALAPEDAYGISKAEAEAGLWQLAQETSMELTIVRPVLVYGPGVRGNFAAMLRWIQLGVPLPLGAVTDNRRSLVALDNLVDLIVTCAEHPRAAGQVFLVSDGEDLSTAQLLRRIAAALQQPARLLPVPVGLLNLAARMMGRQAAARRVLGSLQVDISKNRDLLGWCPPMTMEQCLHRLRERS